MRSEAGVVWFERMRMKDETSYRGFPHGNLSAGQVRWAPVRPLHATVPLPHQRDAYQAPPHGPSMRGRSFLRFDDA